jgi:hypothetical protein
MKILYTYKIFLNSGAYSTCRATSLDEAVFVAHELFPCSEDNERVIGVVREEQSSWMN